jgi:hypothetical protein
MSLNTWLLASTAVLGVTAAVLAWRGRYGWAMTAAFACAASNVALNLRRHWWPELAFDLAVLPLLGWLAVRKPAGAVSEHRIGCKDGQ